MAIPPNPIPSAGDPVGDKIRQRQAAARARLDKYEADIDKAYREGKVPMQFDYQATKKRLGIFRKDLEAAYAPERTNVAADEYAAINSSSVLPARYDAQKLIEAEKQINRYVWGSDGSDGTKPSRGGHFETSPESRKRWENAQAIGGIDEYGRKEGDKDYGLFTSLNSESPTRIKAKDGEPVTAGTAAKPAATPPTPINTTARSGAGVPPPLTGSARTSSSASMSYSRSSRTPVYMGGGGGSASAPASAPAAKAAASTPAAPTTHTVQKGDTLEKLVQKYGTNRASLMLYNDLKDPNQIQVGQQLNLIDPRTVGSTGKPVPTPAEVTSTASRDKMLALYDKTPTGRMDALSARMATDATAKPAAPPAAEPPTKIDVPKITQGISDVGRLAAGVMLAGQNVPLPTVPDRWMRYMNEVQAKKDAGLSAGELATANASVANNYRQGVNVLTNLTGGGSSPGTVLSGLTNLGIQRAQQTQGILNADTAMRQQNFAQYGAATGQTAAMESNIQAQDIARQGANQQAGQQLIGATMQSMENRRLLDRNQPLYDEVFANQIRQQKEAADTMGALREYYKTRAVATTA